MVVLADGGLVNDCKKPGLLCYYGPCCLWYRRTRLDRPKSGIVGQALMGIKTADGKQNFKTYLHFVNFKLRSPSGILLSLSALHAIRGFRMQFALKGI